MRLDKSHDSTVSRTDLGIGSGVRFARKFAKSLTKTSSKVYKPKTYNEAIDDLIYRNRWH